MELSTPNKPAILRLIVDVYEGLYDEFDLNDALNYDSDGNISPQATLMDSQHEKHDLMEEIGSDDDEISVPENILILTLWFLSVVNVAFLARKIACVNKCCQKGNKNGFTRFY